MTCRSICKRRQSDNAFTMIEVVLAITVMALAGSILLLGTSASLQTTQNAMHGAIARGMAQQLMDEIVGCRYYEPGVDPHSTILGPDGSEATGGTRQYFDDSDDFNGLRTTPPKDFYGVALGKDNGQGGTRNPLFQISPGDYRQLATRSGCLLCKRIESEHQVAHRANQRLSRGRGSHYMQSRNPSACHPETSVILCSADAMKFPV